MNKKPPVGQFLIRGPLKCYGVRTCSAYVSYMFLRIANECAYIKANVHV